MGCKIIKIMACFLEWLPDSVTNTMSVQHSELQAATYLTSPNTLLDQNLPDWSQIAEYFSAKGNIDNPWVQVDMGKDRTIAEVQV